MKLFQPLLLVLILSAHSITHGMAQQKNKPRTLLNTMTTVCVGLALLIAAPISVNAYTCTEFDNKVGLCPYLKFAEKWERAHPRLSKNIREVQIDAIPEEHCTDTLYVYDYRTISEKH